MRIAENRWGRYCVPDESSGSIVAQKILAGEVHEPETINRIRAWADQTPRRTIIHAGAYFGDFLPALMRTYCGLCSFEPNPVNWTHACATEHLNQWFRDPDWPPKVVWGALGAREGRVWLQTHSPGRAALGGQSRVVPSARLGHVRVPQLTLDGLKDVRPLGVVHLDTEGHDADAVRGGWKSIRADRPLLIVETPLPADLEAGLFEVGYEREPDEVEHNTVYRPPEPR